ncbi:MAG: hypothetical protein JOY83_10105 [Alphaproteobacteria bacterium]|nr:hypothetical protein [Alphaproteobacteria bacterium]
MPDLDLIKQVEQGVRDRFAKGPSGNPAGWPRGPGTREILSCYIISRQ